MDTGNTREEIDGEHFETARKLDTLTDERKEIISILRETIKGQLEELRRKDPYDADLSKSDKELADMARRCNPLFTKIAGEVHDCDKNDAKFAERLRIAAEAQDPDYWQKRYGRTAKARIEALEDFLHNALVVECNMLALSCECERLNREEHERELNQTSREESPNIGAEFGAIKDGLAVIGETLAEQGKKIDGMGETQAAHGEKLDGIRETEAAQCNAIKILAARNLEELEAKSEGGKEGRNLQLKYGKNVRDSKDKAILGWLKEMDDKIEKDHHSISRAAELVAEGKKIKASTLETYWHRWKKTGTWKKK